MANELQTIAAFTKGLDSFGDAMSYRGMASGYESQASLLDIQGKSIIQSGEFDAQRLREQGDRFLSRQRVGYSKAGVSLEGSPLAVMARTERNISLDIINTRLNAAMQANYVGFQAVQARIAAGQARTRAVQAIGKGVLDMGMSYGIATGKIK